MPDEPITETTAIPITETAATQAPEERPAFVTGGSFTPMPPSSYPRFESLEQLDAYWAKLVPGDPRANDDGLLTYIAERRHALATGATPTPTSTTPPAPALEFPAAPQGATWAPATEALVRDIVADTPALQAPLDALLRAVGAAHELAVAGHDPGELGWETQLDRLAGGAAAGDALAADADALLDVLAVDDEPAVRELGERLAVLSEWDPRVCVALGRLYRATGEVDARALGEVVSGMLTRVGEVKHQAHRDAVARAQRPAAEDLERIVGHFGR